MYLSVICVCGDVANVVNLCNCDESWMCACLNGRCVRVCVWGGGGSERQKRGGGGATCQRTGCKH